MPRIALVSHTLSHSSRLPRGANEMLIQQAMPPITILSPLLTRGIDLRGPLEDDLIRQTRSAWMHHVVIAFSDK